MLIDIDSLDSGYGGVPIVRGVSLALQKGEVLGIVGRNGVGKTTLVKTIAGLLKVTGGRIHYKEHDVTNREIGRAHV